jgi:cytochrome b6-f complex iron-sulfur subunit
MERRPFLKSFAAATLGLVTGSSAARRIEASFGERRRPEASLGTKVATVAGLKVGGQVAFAAPHAGSGSGPVQGLLIHPSAGVYYAVVRSCPHQGCPVSFNQAQKEFLCPCHGSAFTQTGALIQGPAQRGLSRFTVAVSKGSIYVR